VPLSPEDKEIRARIARIGIGPGKTFEFKDLSLEHKADIAPSSSGVGVIWQHVWALLLLTPVACAMAQSMEPRAYTNVPVGLNFPVVAYEYSQGEVGADSSPLQDVDARVHTLPLVYVRSLDVLGRSSTIALVLPLAHLTATASLDGASEVRRGVRFFTVDAA